MISGKHIRLIESNWNEIESRVIRQIRRDPQLAHVRELPDSEINELGHLLMEDLGHWLSGGNQEELASKFEESGKQRYEAGVPLYETVHCLCILREKVVDFVEEHILAKNVMELYAEEQLDRRLGRFFDVLTVRLVKGYERALRHDTMALHI